MITCYAISFEFKKQTIIETVKLTDRALSDNYLL